MMSLLFLGGWNPGVPQALDRCPAGRLDGLAADLSDHLHGKTFFFFIMIAMVKAFVPRYRYDQLMRLGWKVFLPTSLVAVVAVAAMARLCGGPQ